MKSLSYEEFVCAQPDPYEIQLKEETSYKWILFIIEQKKLNKKIGIWGAGNKGKKILDLFNKNGVVIDMIIDKDEEMISKCINGQTVHPYM